MVRVLASHQCSSGSSPGLGVRSGLSLLVVLVLAPRGFSPGTPVFPSPQNPTFLNSNSIWIQWTKSHLEDVPLLIPIYLFLFIFFNLNCPKKDFYRKSSIKPPGAYLISGLINGALLREAGGGGLFQIFEHALLKYFLQKNSNTVNLLLIKNDRPTLRILF